MDVAERAGNLGWGNDEVRAAIRAFDRPTYLHPDHLYRPWAELAEALAGIVPVKRAQCYRATGGSDADKREPRTGAPHR